VVGPAEDGGYYLLGMSRAQAGLFEQVTWSSAQVLAQTKKNAQKKGINLIELETWYDVDQAGDLGRLRQDLENMGEFCGRTRRGLKTL
jgi:glycosyltransferase A (GT-A) superfamily protein (DUF2064 family)